MINIDDRFRPRNILEYPPGNTYLFEEYFYDEFIKSEVKLERIYIPIFWTNYYISKNYGQGDISDIQSIIDKLDRTKKYFTIVQYDDNILNDLKDLDILIFAQGGYGNYKDKSYVIPLNCQSNYQINNIQKDIFASFVGRKTHPIRNTIFDKFRNKEGYFISESIDYNSYKDIMSRSLFSFCPRGYGLTSFRIFESLQCGSIPVYIYDDEFIPFKYEFDFNEIGILIHVTEISKLNDILQSVKKEDILNLQKKGVEIYNNYFDYKGTLKQIFEILINK